MPIQIQSQYDGKANRDRSSSSARTIPTTTRGPLLAHLCHQRGQLFVGRLLGLSQNGCNLFIEGICTGYDPLGGVDLRIPCCDRLLYCLSHGLLMQLFGHLKLPF